MIVPHVGVMETTLGFAAVAVTANVSVPAEQSVDVVPATIFTVPNAPLLFVPVSENRSVVPQTFGVDEIKSTWTRISKPHAVFVAEAILNIDVAWAEVVLSAF